MKALISAKVAIFSCLCFINSVSAEILPGANQTSEYFGLLENKKIGVVANHTSLINQTHLVDSLINAGLNVKKVFAPEHGFRGNIGAGDQVNDEFDRKTGLPIISLYGKNKKPSKKDLEGIDFMVFDIQDVGCRFYTYISTLHYVMEACMQNRIPVIVLDRPNPNGFYVDGPILEVNFSSFVGMHPVPIVYGLTIGEYALMINGEQWLANKVQCDLKVVKCKNYDHNKIYELPVKPSPNLPTHESILLYPSLCLFEGTEVSVGRGTETPFEVIGMPGFSQGEINFTPQPTPGAAPHPKHEGKECSGFKLTKFANQYLLDAREIYLPWLIGFYEESKMNDEFFTPFFDKLAGTDKLRKQILAGKTANEIKASWQDDLRKFKTTRKKYLLYPDFE